MAAKNLLVLLLIYLLTLQLAQSLQRVPDDPIGTRRSMESFSVDDSSTSYQPSLYWNSQQQPQCPSFQYHSGSKIGLQASCPFDWVVDEDANRVPRLIVHQVCRTSCRSCGSHRRCVQLKTRSEVYYQNSREIAPVVIRSGCVCVPKGFGTTSSQLHLIE